MAKRRGRAASGPQDAFRIAGISLVVTGAPGDELKVRNPLYLPFIGADCGADGGRSIAIRWRQSAPPPLSGMRKVFDTRESWSLLDGGKRLWAVYQPARKARPFWIAGFERHAGRVDYHPMAGGKSIHPVGYPLDQLLLMYYLSRRRGMLLHAAGLVRAGKSYLLAGASGAGKSTISGLMSGHGTGRMLSDERMIVRLVEGRMTAFGTPWAGTAGIARQGGAPLAGIFFLAHGRENRIETLDPVPATDRLLPLASIPWYDPDAAARVIAFAKRVLARVPAYEFTFTPDRAAVDFLSDFIKRRRWTA